MSQLPLEYHLTDNNRIIYMSQYLPPVLLTSCIYVADERSVNLVNPDLRIHHTLESVEKWLTSFPAIQLVICDSSNFDFTPLVARQFPNAHIECLAFLADQDKVRKLGKGFGEGEIVKHALQNSVMLKNSDYFAKCTAKLWVENFAECLAQWNGTFLCRIVFDNIFSSRRSSINHVDTRFYLSERTFYEQHFLNAHMKTNGGGGKSIEDSFLEVIQEHHLQSVVFRIPPVIGGVGGGTGKYYNIKPIKRLKEKLRYWLARQNKNFSPLFV